MLGVTTRFNPWIGCSKVHTGCEHCYAESDFDKRRHVVKWGLHGTRVVTTAENWKKPLKWNRKAEKEGVRRRVFCASLADVFEDWEGPILNSHCQKMFIGPNGERMATALDIEHGGAITMKACWRPLTMSDLRRDLFDLIDRTPWLDWQLLTKRPENVMRMWSRLPVPMAVNFRQNVWIGTSVSNQETADKQLPELFKLRELTPVLFVSAEPLLGPFHVRDLPIDWLIIGGESGVGARSCDVSWIRDMTRQRGRALFVKQLGSDPYIEDLDGLAIIRLGLKHPKGGDPSEWPKDLRVQEFPVVKC